MKWAQLTRYGMWTGPPLDPERLTVRERRVV